FVPLAMIREPGLVVPTLAQALHLQEGRGYSLLDQVQIALQDRHTLLLLDATEAYHREVLRNLSDIPESVRELLPRLRDPDFTRVLIVTLPEATPVHEAASLQRDLLRAGITPSAWVINQSLTPLSLTDPVLRARRFHERPFIQEVSETLAARTVLVPWQADIASQARTCVLERAPSTLERAEASS
ncbi:MAG: hypothetical protein KGM43_17745, partial [Planctomycetota bacterium]|nr:hypothetical protein [Planctomycetota bacterium]